MSGNGKPDSRTEAGKGPGRVFWFLLSCAVILAVSPFLGSVSLSPEIFWRLRLPRMAAGLIAGGGLSLCGMCYQGLFRNDLATPYTLGVSGGAALAVTVLVRLQASGAARWTGFGVTPAVAFLGAIGTMALVAWLARRRVASPGGSSMLLLAGVAVSFFFSSVILFCQYFGSPGEVVRVMRWMMGSLDVFDFREWSALCVLVSAGSIPVWFQLDALNLLSLGEEYAAARGVQVRRCSVVLHGAVAWMVGAVVAFCGPIGFVGMVSPHICRLLFGVNHRRLAWSSACFGGCFLVFCDALGRVAASPAELPVGLMTSLIGGPFFLWLLLKRR